MENPALSASEDIALGLHHHRKGNLAEAEAAYRRALAVDPENVEAFNNLGMIASRVGQHDIAIELIRRAVASRQHDPDLNNNLGEALRGAGRLQEAVEAYSAALRSVPDHAGANCNLGVVLQKRGDFAGARECYLRALKTAPHSAEVHNNLGNLYKEFGRVAEAVSCYSKALSLLPDSLEALNNLGVALKDLGRVSEAIRCFRLALEKQPLLAYVHSNLMFALQYSGETDAREIFDEGRRYAAQFEYPLKAAIRPHRNQRDPARCLRVGYVSSDFRRHPVALYIESIVANHSRETFEVFCYYSHHSQDSTTQRIKASADHWRDVGDVSDERLAEIIRHDGIDILVDLAGHSSGNRLLVFVRKPAPVQLSYLGYLGTTGLDAMDYRITDWHADPAGTEMYSSERLLRLPDSLWCYRPSFDTDRPPLPDGQSHVFVTLGSLNNVGKISDETIALWARILRDMPSTKLLMATIAPGETRDRIVAQFADHGIPRERLELVDRMPAEEFRKLHSRIDIALDPFPCNGGATTCEILWAGVPLVTLAGSRLAGRAGVSLLTNAGLAELIAQTPEDYVAIAKNLIEDRVRLQALKAKIRECVPKSPLMDGHRFVRNLEAGYRQCWREWCM